MAFVDRPYTFCEKQGPTALRRNSTAPVGTVIDTLSGARRNTRIGFISANPFFSYFGGNDTYINFRIHAPAANTDDRNYTIGLYTRDDLTAVPSSGDFGGINLSGFGRSPFNAEFDGHRLIAGATFHMAFVPLAHYERYFQIGVSSLSNITTETLRFSAWVSSQKLTYTILPEGLE